MISSQHLCTANEVTSFIGHIGCRLNFRSLKCVVQLPSYMSTRSAHYAKIGEIAAKVRVRVCSKVDFYTELFQLLRVDALGRMLFGGYCPSSESSSN